MCAIQARANELFRGLRVRTLVAFSVVLVTGSGYAQIASADANSSVHIVDFDFQPGVLALNPGDTVTWTNSGNVEHTVTSDTGVWDSSALASGATFSQRFTAPGTFSYRCTIHPGMHGLIFVPSAPGQQPTANDGQQFSSQSANTQAFFSANFGDQAALEWVREHDAALPPQPAPAGGPAGNSNSAPAAPTPALAGPAPAPVAPAPPPPTPVPDYGPAAVPSY